LMCLLSTLCYNFSIFPFLSPSFVLNL
jgi:hypothetical protein